MAYLLEREVVEVEQETPRVINIQEINPEEFKEPEVLKTIEQALLSETLLLRVIKANGLDKDVSFAPPKPDGSNYLDSELVQRFRAKLVVSLRRGSRLIDIIVQDPDPKRAQQLAQSMVKEFVDQQSDQQVADELREVRRELGKLMEKDIVSTVIEL